MRAKQQRHAALLELHDAVKRLARKSTIAHRQGFVNDQNIGLHGSGDGKRKPHIHAAGVRSNGLIDELADVCKVNDFLKVLFNVLRLHAIQRCAEENVFAARKVLVKASAQL